MVLAVVAKRPRTHCHDFSATFTMDACPTSRPRMSSIVYIPFPYNNLALTPGCPSFALTHSWRLSTLDLTFLQR